MVYPQKRGFYRNENFKLLSGFFAILSFLGRLFLNVFNKNANRMQNIGI
jgi:hypothetical protein